MTPPPRFPQQLPHAPAERPLNRPHGQPTPSFSYNDYTRKPIPGITRPNSDRNLPNILPQFRPNAKVSSGHPSNNNNNFNQEPGNIRVGPSGQQPPKRPLNNHYQFAHRRQPLNQQKRYPMNRISEYPAGPPPPPPMAVSEANRRVYRLPPYPGQSLPFAAQKYMRRPLGPRLPAEGFGLERHALGSNNNNLDSYKTLPQSNNMVPERMAAFEEEDLVINDPPQPVAPSKEKILMDETKLEPVVTLQMLQSFKKPLSLPTDDSGAGEIQVPSLEEEKANNELPKIKLENLTSPTSPFVVYPAQGQANKAETQADNMPIALPAVALLESAPTGSEYQNTPFSVVRDKPQEPILKNKKPQSLQQQNKSQPPKDKFPYPIEKPDPSYSELSMTNQVPGVLIAPRIINGAYGSGTEAPIAIAYTPTEPNAYKRKYSNVNLATPVITEIRHDSQTEEGPSIDFDNRGQHFEKNFMAPFYPSVSLGTATNSPSNGWNIVDSTTNKNLYEKNKINRADVEEENLETTTKSFELDSFQPELQGGFKPIYPPGYKLESEESPSMPAMENKPIAMAISATTSASITSTTVKPKDKTTSSPLTSSSSSTSTTAAPPNSSSTTTSAPKEKKKTPFETSLEALLFGDDEDFEEGRAKIKMDQPVAMALHSAPRNVPRSGPRSLKLR